MECNASSASRLTSCMNIVLTMPRKIILTSKVVHAKAQLRVVNRAAVLDR